jgi:D-serine deaminase-like pyridoxal phosphate-dependent protein
MLLQEGCDTLVAYPQVGPSATRLVELAQQYPQAACSTIVDSLPAAQHLAAAASSANVKMDVLIDLNTGMDRTGILPNESAVALAKQVAQLELLRLVGLHVYDGQNHQSQRAQRDAAVAELMDSVWKLVQQLHELGLSIGSLVCGGTPTFPVFAEIAKSWRQTHSQIRIELSPGTSVLSDYNYSRDYDDLSAIKPAVVLLTRIVSKPGDGLITVDLGHKAVAADQPAGRRCHFVEIPDAQELKHSEEHLVVRTNLADRLAIGQVLRVLPAHVCPTVALHESMLLVNDHRIDGVWPITRHRLYR